MRVCRLLPLLLLAACSAPAAWTPSQLGDGGDHVSPFQRIPALVKDYGAFYSDSERLKAAYLHKRMLAVPALFAAAGLVQINDRDEQWTFDLVTDPILEPKGTKRSADAADVGLYTLFGAALWAPVLFPVDDGSSRWTRFITAGETSLVTLGVVEGIRALELRERPDGGDGGFISGHVAHSVAYATLLQREYGWRVGAPAYLASTAVAIWRIQSARHFPADTLIGAGFGYLIANVIYDKNHGLRGFFTPADSVALLPIIEQNALGLGLRWDW